MKLLLISDIHHFSTKDMYSGYISAFDELGIDYEVVPMHELTNPMEISHFSLDGAYGLALAKLLNKENGFTHCINISGLKTPGWFYKSGYDKKMCVIASDDPHASKILEQYKDSIDYWFSNEKNLKGDKIHYLPTATTHILPKVSKSELPPEFRYDIVFIGTVYDGRIKMLESVCEYCKENKLPVKICGPLLRTPKDSIIREYAEEKIIDNRKAKLLYRGARVVINLDRDIHWNVMDNNGENSCLIDVGEAYSTNPRVYEIAGCRATQLFVHPRQEVIDIFGDNVYYSEEDTIKERLDEIFKEKYDVILEKINNCFQIVSNNHTYINRVKTMLSILEGEKNVE